VRATVTSEARLLPTFEAQAERPLLQHDANYGDSVGNDTDLKRCREKNDYGRTLRSSADGKKVSSLGTGKDDKTRQKNERRKKG